MRVTRLFHNPLSDTLVSFDSQSGLLLISDILRFDDSFDSWLADAGYCK